MFEQVHRENPNAVVRFLLNHNGENKYINITPNTYKKYLLGEGVEATQAGSDEEIVNILEDNLTKEDIKNVRMWQMDSVVGGLCSKRINQLYKYQGTTYLSLRNPVSGMCLVNCLKYFNKYEGASFTIPEGQPQTVAEALKVHNFKISLLDENGRLEILNEGDASFALLLFRCHWFVENPKAVGVSIGKKSRIKVEGGEPKTFRFKKEVNEIQEKPSKDLTLPNVNIFYDLETVYAKDIHDFKPYQAAIYGDDLPATIFTGFDCIRQMLNALFRISESKHVTLISFNGSRFDDLFTQKEIMCAGIGFHCTPTNNGILSLTFKNITCFDLSRYLIGSLAQNAKDFKTKNQKVEGYNHYVIQKLYENDEPAFWDKISSDEAHNYLTQDVKTLGDLFNETRKTFEKLDVDLTKSPTIGSAVVRIWKTKERQLIKEGKCMNLDKATHDFIRSSLVAGRAESINGRRFINNQVEIIDVVSLYPSVVGLCDDEIETLGFEVFYPWGQWSSVEHRDRSKLGFYEVKIKCQRSDIMNVIPRRQDGKPLDWKFKGAFSCVLCSTDIDVFEKYHGANNIEVGKGIEFAEKI